MLTFDKTIGKWGTAMIALWISRLGVVYPLIAVALAQTHYALMSRNLNEKTEAALILLTFPICLCCVFAFVLSSWSEGRTRTTVRIWSVLGIILNVALFVTTGISD